MKKIIEKIIGYSLLIFMFMLPIALYFIACYLLYILGI